VRVARRSAIRASFFLSVRIYKMDFQLFVRTHLPALERDEVRFGILIGALTAHAAD
jgi:hypothetical protein